MFPCFWLVKPTCIIHHNQLLLTKFGKNFVMILLNQWHQKFCHIAAQPVTGYWLELLTEKTWGQGCIIFGEQKIKAAVIRGRRLFKNCTRRICFFYIFIQRYTFYLLIFLWTDTKLIVNLELREKFTRWKKPREFHDNESEIISGESELLCRCGTIYSHCLRIGGAALIRGRRLIRGPRSFFAS